MNYIISEGSSVNLIALDIEHDTQQNTNYRRVISTSPTMQLVLMSLKPGEEIGMEQHDDTTQFIRVEEGYGRAILTVQGIRSDVYLKPGVALFIPPSSPHNIINTSDRDDLKLYTLYSPPEHPHGLIQPIKNNKNKK